MVYTLKKPCSYNEKAHRFRRARLISKSDLLWLRVSPSRSNGVMVMMPMMAGKGH
jgi:hypothetical protein